MRVVIPVPDQGFDPTEVAVPWQILTSAGVECTFATVSGGEAAADPIMVDGVGLYMLKWSMRADSNGRGAYAALVRSGALKNTVTFAQLRVSDFSGALLPGGHCPDMRPYLEDDTLKAFVSEFAESGKPLAAICHGVVLAARAGILGGKRVTALPSWMESLAFNLTRSWMGNYYKTYPETSVEAEVRQACAEYAVGPRSLTRDSPKNPACGFTVRDGSLLTARWPGDAHALGHEFLSMLKDGETQRV